MTTTLLYRILPLPDIAGRLCSRLADILGQADREQSILYLLEAAGSYRQIGNDAQAMDHLYKVAAGLFEKGKIKNKALLSQLVSSISDPSALRVIQLWEQFGNGAAPRDVQKKVRPFDRLRKIFSPEPESLSDKTPLEEIASYANVCEALVTYCLLDLTEQIIKVCSAEQIIDIIRALIPRAGQILRQHLGSVMLKNATEDIAFLVQYYTGGIAEKKLAYYEKCMQVMESLEIEQFATIAGNLALVYRRRNEEEKTFRYHTTSMELYQKSGETKEYLIEMLNMSTAYRHFYRREEAIQLLQKGIKEAGEANAKILRLQWQGTWRCC